jgi:hypothetical protein
MDPEEEKQRREVEAKV